MKALCCTIFLLLTLKAASQDTLYLVSGTKEAVVLLEVNPDNLRYKRFNNQTGPTYTVLKTDVSSVKYKNGKSDIFSKATEVVAETPKEKEPVKLPKDTITEQKQEQEDPFFANKADTLFFKSGKRTEAKVLIDFGGRNWIVWNAEFTREKIGEMPTEMFFHFFKSFSDAAKCNLNIECHGDNEHHKIEAIFKAFAKAIRMAVKRDPISNYLPSTKGLL